MSGRSPISAATCKELMPFLIPEIDVGASIYQHSSDKLVLVENSRLKRCVSIIVPRIDVMVFLT